MSTCYILSGYPASGKSTALNEAYRNGLYTLESSDIVRDEFQAQKQQDVNDDELGEWASTKREEFGDGIMAEYCIDRISMANYSGNVAISGIRSEEEVRRFSSYPGFDNVIVIGIRCREDVRFERMKERDGVDEDYFTSRNQREQEWGLEKLLNRHTNIILRNTSCTEQRFRKKVSNFLQ